MRIGDVFIMNVMRISLVYLLLAPVFHWISSRFSRFFYARDPFRERKKSFIQTNKTV